MKKFIFGAIVGAIATAVVCKFNDIKTAVQAQLDKNNAEEAPAVEEQPVENEQK